MTFIDEVKAIRAEAIAYLSDDPSGVESWRRECAKILVADWLEPRIEAAASSTQNADTVFCVYASWRASRNDFIVEQMLNAHKGSRRYSDETIKYMTLLFEERVAMARNAYLADRARTLFEEFEERAAESEMS